MKTMTCQQLHGPCDALIRGESAQEMMENGQKHGLEMAAKGDKAHIEIMERFRKQREHMTEEDIKPFMEKFNQEFDNLPEDK